MVQAARSDDRRAVCSAARNRNHVRAGNLSATGARPYQQHRYKYDATLEVATDERGQSRNEDERVDAAGTLAKHLCFGILIMLAWTIYISFLGVLVLLLPKVSVRAARTIAMLTATGGFAVSLVEFAQQSTGT